MLRIGDFARLSQMSVKALRFYDEIGLLKPTFVDRTTGYRYYAPSLLSRLNQILAFKELGVSLAEIAQLLQTNLSGEQLRGTLERKRLELSRRIASEQAQLAQVDAWLQELTTGAPAQQIVLKQTPTQFVASMRSTLSSYDDADELFIELQDYLRQYKRTGQRAAIWHACAGSSDHIDCEALILLEDRVPENNRVRVYELASDTVATIIHEGSEETIEQSYRDVRGWIKSHGYALAGPTREYYWQEARAHSDASEITEIQYPIFIKPQPIPAGN